MHTILAFRSLRSFIFQMVGVAALRTVKSAFVRLSAVAILALLPYAEAAAVANDSAVVLPRATDPAVDLVIGSTGNVINVVMRNTGDLPWDSSYGLNCVGCSVPWTPISLGDASSVLNQDTGNFSVVINAPPQLGQYTYNFRMAPSSGGTNFGKTVSVKVNVVAAYNAAPTVTMSAPSAARTVTVLPGQKYPLTVAGQAYDSDAGDVATAEVWDNGNPQAIFLSSGSAVINLAGGLHKIALKAKDNHGAVSALTTAIPIQVNTATGGASFTGLTLYPANQLVVNPGGKISIGLQFSVQSNDDGFPITQIELKDGDPAFPAQATRLDYATRTPTRNADGDFVNTPWDRTATPMKGDAVDGSHKLFVIATSLSGATISQALSATVRLNTAPTVSLLPPPGGTSYVVKANTTQGVVLNGSATDLDGVASLQLYVDGSPIGSPLTSVTSGTQYAFSASLLANGVHSLVLHAVDKLGLASDSPPVSVTVNPNKPPSLTLNLPGAGPYYVTPGATQSVTLTGNVSDSDGSISSLRIFDGATDIGAAGWSGGSYSGTVYLSASPQAHQLSVRATDNLLDSATSNIVSVTVTTNNPPTVSFNTIVDNYSYVAANGSQASVHITGTGADKDGNFSKIELFVNDVSTNLSTTTTNFDASRSLVVGRHKLTLKASDTLSANGTAIAHINVGVPGVVLTGVTQTSTGTAPDANGNVKGGISGRALGATDSGDDVAEVQLYERITDSGGTRDVLLDKKTFGVTWIVANEVVSNVAQPFTFSRDFAGGNHTIFVRAVSRASAAVKADSALFTVNAPVATFVSTSQTNTGGPSNPNKLFESGINFTANAASATHQLISVKLFKGSPADLANAVLLSTYTCGTSPCTGTLTSLFDTGETSIFVQASTDNGTAVSPVYKVTVGTNTKPTARITSPPNGQAYNVAPGAKASVTVVGNGSDTDGSIGFLELLDNEQVIWSGNQGPNLNQSLPLDIKTHVLKLRATDNLGATGVSDPVTVTVTASVANSAAVVVLDTPVSGAGYLVAAGTLAQVHVSGHASDPDGYIKKLELLVDNVPGPSVNGPTLDAVVPLAISGTPHTLQLRATDSRDQVVPGQVTLVNVTETANNATFLSVSRSALSGLGNPTFNAGLRGTVKAVDDSATVRRVELREGNTVLLSTLTYPIVFVGGEVSNPVRAFNLLADLNEGNHDLYARAYMNDGAQGDTEILRITVTGNKKPVPTINQPTNERIFDVDVSGNIVVPVDIAGSDADGSVTKLELFDGSNPVPIASADGNSLQTNVTLVAGTHILTLRATDNIGATTTSDPVTINAVSSGAKLNPVFTAPADGYTIPGPIPAGGISVTVSGTCRFCSVGSLELFDGAQLKFTSTSSTFSTSLLLQEGVHTLTLRKVGAPSGTSITIGVGTSVVPAAARFLTLPVNETVFIGDASAATSVAVSARTPSTYANTFSALDLYVDNSFFKTYAGRTVFDTVPLNVGDHTLRIYTRENGIPVAQDSINVHVKQNVPPNVPQLAQPTANSSYVAAGGDVATITVNASATDPDNNLSRVEVLDAGASIATITGANVSTDISLKVGVHTIKLRATDAFGLSRDSDPITVSVVSSVLGSATAVRINATGTPQLIGWMCQASSPAGMPYQVYAYGGPSTQGSVLLGGGTANVATEPDNAAVQSSCNTPGIGHNFVFDLSAYTSQYAGVPLYLQATKADGMPAVIPCGANICTMPGSLRVGLSTPANGDRYSAPATVFMRAELTNGAGPYDEVAFNINGEWITAAPDNGSNAYFAMKSGLAPSAMSYPVYAKVRQGNSTLVSVTNQIYIEGASSTTLALGSPKNGDSFAPGSTISLSATPGGVTAGVQAVKFYANGAPIASATNSGGAWTASWKPTQNGSYAITASALDGAGKVLGQTSLVTVSVVQSSTGVETPIAVNITPPELGSAMAGTLPGELGINNAGAATYGIPIVVPPGTAGLQPAISLDYNSQGGNGIVGLGWSLGGLSRIQRCGQTIAQDGYNARINFSLTDRLCLDGQRLVLVNQAMNDANYWSDSAEYRTELDTFSRILAQGVTTAGNLANRSFKVTSKDGRVMTYGRTASSVVKAVYKSVNAGFAACAGISTSCLPASGNGPVGWALDTVKDRFDNYISYNYEQNSDSGEHVLKDIRYGGKGLAPHASVVFTNDTTRSDAWTRYIDAARSDLRQRVINISTYVGDDLTASATAGTRIRSYSLAYQRSPTSGRSLLKKISVVARNPQTSLDDALPESVFSWGEPDSKKTAGFDTAKPLSGGPQLSQPWADDPTQHSTHSELFAFADFENHGFTDVLEKSLAPLEIPPGQIHYYADRALKTSYRYYHNSDGKAFTEYRYALGTGEAFSVVDTADFNGDGAPDLLIWNGTKLKICLSPLGGGTGPGVPGSIITFTCPPDLLTTGSYEARYLPYVTDVRGDGRSGLYGRIEYDGAPSTLCMQTICKPVADPPGDLLGFSYAQDGSPEFYRHDYAEFVAMVDFAGVGKPYDTRFSKPGYVRVRSFDLTPSEISQWVNTRPAISMLAVDEPGATVSMAPMVQYTYRNYVPVGANPHSPRAFAPYSFEDNYPGMGRDADFNGSGYSSLAFGFREYNWLDNYFEYSKAEMTLCLSTGRSLDCHVRKKYSGSTLNTFDGPGTDSRMQYLAVRGVGNFIGDGQANILAESVAPGAGGPFPTTHLYMCRVMGDDVSHNADGSDDSNIACDPWKGSTPQGDQRFFMDMLGTGRTQMVNYHEDWLPGATKPTVIWNVSEPVDVAVTGQALDRIYAVTNGLGATSTVTYTDGLVDGTVKHSGALALTYPQHLSSGVGKYATKLTRANGVSGTLVRNYIYQDPVIDVQGRGSLGFAHVTVKDEDSLVQTDTDYHVQWPLTGMVRKAVVSRGVQMLSQTDNIVSVTPIVQANNASTMFPAVLNSKVQRWDLSGTNMGTTTTSGLAGGSSSIAYDKYGNMLSSRVVVDGGGQTLAHTTDTVNTYATTDTDRLYMGLPDAVTVTKSHNDGGTAVARKVGFEYESHGKIKTQTVEPDNAALKLKTTFAYDSVFGVLRSRLLEWTDPDTGAAASRTDATMTYDARARYPSTVSNAVPHTETHVYDAGTGARIKLTGPNSLATTWEVDGFGRVSRELRADGNETRVYIKQCFEGCPASTAAATITDQFHGKDRIAVPQVVYADSVGHVLRTLTWGFDGSAITSNKTYDSIGMPLEEEVPHYGSAGVRAVHREYDALRRPVLVQTFNGNDDKEESTTAYDGLKVTRTNAKSQVRVEYQNVLVQTTSVKNQLTTPTKKTVTTSFGYDAWGGLVKTIDPNGNVITVQYDTLGRKIQLNDPDLGRIDYSVNPLGLTWKQVNPIQRIKAALPTPPANPYTKMKYDALNRMVDRLEDNLESHWIYDTAAVGIGQLAEAYTGKPDNKDYRRVHTYDALGRPAATTQQLYDGSYVSAPKYDAWGRVITLSYVHANDPAREFAQRYNQFGYLARVERKGLVLWEATKQDALHRPTTAALGNGLVQTDTYDEQSGRLKGSLTKAGTAELLKEGYEYDKLGNVTLRTQYWAGTGFSELFDYDDLNRLKLSQIGAVPKVFTYDDAGNLMSKTGVGNGNYTYPTQGATAVKPHAVSSIAGVPGSFSYDDNGNLLSDPWHTATWNNFDMPIKITKGSKSSAFVYGPEHQRTRQTRDDNTMTVYGGAQEVELDSQGRMASVKTYWPMGLGLEIDKANATTTELHWLHRDRLGSPVAISGETGVVQEQLAYDAWGKHRLPDGSAVPDSLDGVIDNKGYTGHEMLDPLDLVHMNGRVYDPFVAKFMSGDPLISDTANGQNYNRYSYVLNNPTNITDPTGFDPTVTISGSRLESAMAQWDFNNLLERVATAFKEGRTPSLSMTGKVSNQWSRTITRTTVTATVSNGSSEDSSANSEMKDHSRRSPGDPLQGVVQEFHDYGTNERGQQVVGTSARRVELPDHASGMVDQMFMLPVIGVTAGTAGLEVAAYRAYRWHQGRQAPQPKSQREVKYDPRVRARGVEDPVSHNFPYSFDAEILSSTPIQRPDGYTIYQAPGSMTGSVVTDINGVRTQTYKDGMFEIGVNKDGVIDHRFFRPNK